jgi:hypothetical protein
MVFDDTMGVPEALRSLTGVDHFGSLVFRRRSQLEAARVAAEEAGWPPLIHLSSDGDVENLVGQLREQDSDRLYLFCPSYLVPACGRENLVTFLKQITYSPSWLHIPAKGKQGRRGWSLLGGPMLHKLLQKRQEGDVAGFFEQYGSQLVEVRDRLNLIDVSDERTLYDFLSGQFDTRYFNAVERDEFTVIKRSRDRAKLKREFDFYRLVPPRMQMFLVQPFEFHDDGEVASYHMERLGVPDMALQWVHGAFEPEEFDRFLEHIFYFIGVRPERRVDGRRSAAVRDELYVEKVTSRTEALKALPAYTQLQPLLECACGGIDRLVQRYLTLYERMRKRFPSGRLVIGHGDPCFSNILYSKANQCLKLIDPRGAATEAELYTDPYYDAAKLSHSVLGLYDFINQELFDISVGKDLKLDLTFEPRPLPWAASMFVGRLEAAGFDPVLTRLCEASLFISMLPLHVDHPSKVLAFAINADRILDVLSEKRAVIP